MMISEPTALLRGARVFALTTQVEFMEEVQAGEISVSEWDTPYDNGDSLWNVCFGRRILKSN